MVKTTGANDSVLEALHERLAHARRQVELLVSLCGNSQAVESMRESRPSRGPHLPLPYP